MVKVHKGQTLFYYDKWVKTVREVKIHGKKDGLLVCSIGAKTFSCTPDELRRRVRSRLFASVDELLKFHHLKANPRVDPEVVDAFHNSHVTAIKTKGYYVSRSAGEFSHPMDENDTSLSRTYGNDDHTHWW